MMEPFTPQDIEPNHLYIARPDLEQQVSDGLDKYRCCVVTGVSGSGKTWLMKTVLSNKFYKIFPVRIAIGSTLRNSILDALEIEYVAHKKVTKFGSKADFLKVLGFSAEESNEETATQVDIVKIINRFCEASELDHVCLAFDNLEDASEDIFLEIRDLIKGDEHFNSRVKMFFVEAVNISQGLEELLSDATVARRCKFISNIRGLNPDEICQMFQEGFGKTNILPNDIKLWADHCHDATNGISSYVHEYGNALYRSLEVDDPNFSDQRVVLTDWMNQTNSAVVNKIKANLNAGRGQRRDQIMYVMANAPGSMFRSVDLENSIREKLLDGKDSNIQLGAALNHLVENNVLRKIGSRYEFCDSRMKGLLRLCLEKSEGDDRVTW